jgi:serine protease Do
VTQDIADSLGIAKSGALVADVVPGGPSDAAGLKSGDIVAKVNGHAVTSAADLTRQVGQVRSGDTIRLEVRHNGQTREVAVRSGLRPSENQLALNDGSGGADEQQGVEGAGLLGMRVAPDQQGRGVRVAGLSGDSDAAQKGIRPGDLIERAGTSPTHSPADLAHAVDQARHAGRKEVLLMVTRGGQHIFVPVEVGKG